MGFLAYFEDSSLYRSADSDLKPREGLLLFHTPWLSFQAGQRRRQLYLPFGERLMDLVSSSWQPLLGAEDFGSCTFLGHQAWSSEPNPKHQFYFEATLQSGT